MVDDQKNVGDALSGETPADTGEPLAGVDAPLGNGGSVPASSSDVVAASRPPEDPVPQVAEEAAEANESSGSASVENSASVESESASLADAGLGDDHAVAAEAPVADSAGNADQEEEGFEDVEPLEEINEQDEEDATKDWYILKVQSNREESIRDGLCRRIAVAGLDRYVGDIIVPTEDVAEFKNGKKRITKRKLYPGYIVVNMAINDDIWFLVRETPGIGDFTGSAGKPTPMLPHEVDRIVQSSKAAEEGGEPVKTAIPFNLSDRVRIKEGTFENFEGDVDEIDEANGRVTIMINIFGRSTPIELEHWQIETV